MKQSTRTKWYKAEELVCKKYIELWFSLIEKNFTRKWWEIDIIFQKDNLFKFVEVKTIIDKNQIENIVNQSKIDRLVSTIDKYFIENEIYNFDWDLEFCFVDFLNRKIIIYKDFY